MSSDKVLAGPSAACCLRGTIHTGSPSGTISEIAGVQTYVATPPAGKANGNIVLYFPDVFGLFINGQLIMDGFAEAGYLVLGPDYFRGDPVTKYRKDFSNPDENPGFDMNAWMQKHQAFSDPWVPKFVDEVKAKYGEHGTKYACVGYW
jgi:dienelactone hydrolase